MLIRLPEFLYYIICVSCDTSKFEDAFKDGDDSEQNLFGEKQFVEKISGKGYVIQMSGKDYVIQISGKGYDSEQNLLYAQFSLNKIKSFNMFFFF